MAGTFNKPKTFVSLIIKIAGMFSKILGFYSKQFLSPFLIQHNIKWYFPNDRKTVQKAEYLQKVVKS